MLTRIDHVVIAVPRLEQGIDAYMRLGFAVHPGGVHPSRGTRNAIAFFGEDYYRTRRMEAAARVMAAHGVSPPARGVRNAGEQAMLVGPGDACGAYAGLAGPA